MRTLSNDLRAEIMAGSIANLMKITLSDSTVLAYTDFDETITVDGVQYVPAPGLQKVKYTLTATAEISNQEFGSGWVEVPDEDLKAGKFDDAVVQVGWASWKFPEYGQLIVFTGQIGELSWTEEGFVADIVSFMKNLGKNIGTVFTSNCRHSLGSQPGPGTIGGCMVDLTTFRVTEPVSSIQTQKWKFTVATLAVADHHFSNGTARFLTGNNAGLTAIIKKQVGDVIELFLPTAFVIGAGDSVELTAGCDLTLNSCKNKFDNVVNFGGFPHIQPDVNFR